MPELISMVNSDVPWQLCFFFTPASSDHHKTFTPAPASCCDNGHDERYIIRSDPLAHMPEDSQVGQTRSTRNQQDFGAETRDETHL
ncbi:hypothetical protein Q5P01_015174 [Channa striata]|uniref:Uncharacterized protein n=1 Tax=Channa striata TaxID=64152 RepID=A0AA88MK47_CHASR|nr:hypothetical protein Q5P01_015174 [Channa striata]